MELRREGNFEPREKTDEELSMSVIENQKIGEAHAMLDSLNALLDKGLLPSVEATQELDRLYGQLQRVIEKITEVEQSRNKSE